MNDYKSRFIAKAVELYDARRAMGIGDLYSLYSTSAGLANALGVTRDKACALLLAALEERRNTPTLEILPC